MSEIYHKGLAVNNHDHVIIRERGGLIEGEAISLVADLRDGVLPGFGRTREEAIQSLINNLRTLAANIALKREQETIVVSPDDK